GRSISPDIRDLATLPAQAQRGPALVVAQPHANGGTIPSVGGPGPIYFAPGAFTFPGGTTPGTADYDHAIVVDPMSRGPPPACGGGDFSITVAGTAYATAAGSSMSGVFTDDTGTQYLVIAVFTEVTDPVTGVDTGTVVQAIVLASDFAVGATVSFDGVD